MFIVIITSAGTFVVLLDSSLIGAVAFPMRKGISLSKHASPFRDYFFDRTINE